MARKLVASARIAFDLGAQRLVNVTPNVFSPTPIRCQQQEQILSCMNLFLVDLIQRNCDPTPEALSEHRASPKVPHPRPAVVAGACRHGPLSQVDFVVLQFEGDDRVISFLDDRPLDHQLDGGQAFSPVPVFAVPDTRQFVAVSPFQLDGAALAGSDRLGNAPGIQGFGILATGSHQLLLTGSGPCRAVCAGRRGWHPRADGQAAQPLACRW
jgi:hypothetical protein